MPYNSETSQYERRSTTVIDATPDGDTVAVAIDTKLDLAADDAVIDLNHHMENGRHYPATSSADNSRFLKQSPAGVVSWANGIPFEDGVGETELAASTGSAMVGYVQATGATSRTVQDRLRDIPTIKDSGAKGDGSTDDTPAVNAAEASSIKARFVPEGDYPTTKANFNSLTKKYFGLGQIGTTAGKLPFFFSKVGSRPDPLGNHGSPLTAFDGDLDGVIFHIGHSITGADTLGQPATGYLQTPEATPLYLYCYNTSGHNEALDSNDGRTGMIAQHTRISHAGQGDATCWHGNVIVTGQKPEATFCLARPAGALWGGSVLAGVADCNLMMGEVSVRDQGFDGIRATGLNMLFTRDSNVRTAGSWWNGLRLVSNGAYEVDAAIQVYQKWGIGLDFAGGTISRAAIAMKADQRIEFHAEAPVSDGVAKYAETLNGWDMRYNSALPGFEWRTAGTARLRLSATGLAVLGTGSSLTVTGTGGMLVSGGSATISGGGLVVSGGNIQMNGYSLVKDGDTVVGARKTGWSAATGAATRTSFATSTVTTAQLAERVKALIDDLISHGLIGA